MPECSFVVIAFNEEANIERTLTAISGQRELDDYEIIVVDDGSTDRTAAAVQEYAGVDSATRLLVVGRNTGRGAARAVGVRSASGRYIATVDADITVPPEWFTTCREHIQDIDVVSGTPVADGDVQYIRSRFGLTARPTATSAEITGSNALFRREVFDVVAYDPRLRNGEDVALCYAMRRAGVRMRRLTDLTVAHDETKSFLSSFAWLFESGVGASRQFRRYRQIRRPDVAFAIWLASVSGAGMWAARSRQVKPMCAPIALTAAISAAHVREKFVVHGARPSRLVLSTVTHAMLLFAYFLGRLGGLVWMSRMGPVEP